MEGNGFMDKRYAVEIRGVSPYLMNRFNEADIEGKTKKRSGTQNDDEEKYEKKFYRLPNGSIYVPSTQIVGALVNAGKQMQIKGKGKSTYSKLFGSTLDVDEEAIPMISDEPVAYKISAVNPATGKRMMVTRPRFENWSLKFTLVCIDDQVSDVAIQDGLETAGKYVGIGDWRPYKRGKFGKFVVASFKELK